MKSVVWAFFAFVGVSMVTPQKADASFLWDRWDREVYVLDTRVVSNGPRPGTLRLENGMVLDQSIERFILTEPLHVGDHVRLIFDDTRFLRRVVRLH